MPDFVGPVSDACVPVSIAWFGWVGTRLAHKNCRCLTSARPFSIESKNMSDEKWIVSDKDHPGGKPRVQGTRISLLECLASAMSRRGDRRCLFDVD